MTKAEYAKLLADVGETPWLSHLRKMWLAGDGDRDEYNAQQRAGRNANEHATGAT